MSCNSPLLFVVLFFVLMAFMFGVYSNTTSAEAFYLSDGYIRSAAPYYTTTFQAYPGKYMNYSSTRSSYCLQQHPEYSGYRNCMLYLQ